MKALQDIKDLENSDWGDEEIITEIEIRRGLSRPEAQQWLDEMRGHDVKAEAMEERRESARDWRRENITPAGPGEGEHTKP